MLYRCWRGDTEGDIDDNGLWLRDEGCEIVKSGKHAVKIVSARMKRSNVFRNALYWLGFRRK